MGISASHKFGLSPLDPPKNPSIEYKGYMFTHSFLEQVKIQKYDSEGLGFGDNLFLPNNIWWNTIVDLKYFAFFLSF